MKSVFESLNDIYLSYRNDNAVQMRNFDSVNESARSIIASCNSPSTTVTQIQQISNAFGKKGCHIGNFGNHPDFQYLSGTTSHANGFVGTLFIDIEGSSKLSLFYTLPEVFRIKNAIIQSSIAVIQAIDGHVHRIMGDAVMAYFRSDGRDKYTSAIDIVNAASVLKLFFEKKVLPTLSQNGFNDDFGIRIGIDWADDSDVIWSSYGYGEMEEITATSFYVDIASKLQHSAGKNNIQMGNSIKAFLDFPEELLTIKEVKKNGVSIPDPYVKPNYILPNGKELNYRKWLLNVEKYTAQMPQITFEPCFVKMEVYDEKEGNYISEYYPCSKGLEKGQWIKFSLNTYLYKAQGYKGVHFDVENHGSEASLDEKNGNHNDYKSFPSETNTIVHWEHTAYRGLHYMKVKLDGPKNISKSYGIFVQ